MVNTPFTPSDKELSKAYAILDAMADAKAKGQGAVALDGKLIDLASIRQAEAMVAKHEGAGGTRESISAPS